ncbi:MAG: hypothetical protein EBS18_05265, partial [Actinobacteria bacterium]|nr:hypothetical protein [Actinomycetota bacterium]
MPLKKILFKPGVNKENTRYTSENGWYVSDKVRFRQGTPEKIGGWAQISANTFLGICRSLWNWVTLGFQNLISVGTNLKYYIERGGTYYDITPIRSVVTLGANPFTGNGTTTVVVTATAHGAVTNDFVTFSGVTGTYASLLNAEYQITIINVNSYSITTASVVAAGATGGSAVVATYQINTGPAIQVPYFGWGAGGWGFGTWGNGVSTTIDIRLWSANNWGEDLIFGPRGGGLYYWDATNGVSTRGVNVNTLGGTVTLTIASPCVITLSVVLVEGTAIKLATTSALPTGLTAGTTYYLRNVDGVTANLSATPAGAIINTSGSQSGVQSISTLVDVPTLQNYILVSDTSRFVLLFGTTDYASVTLDPMLIRWSNQESVIDWTPSPLNQAGSIRLSHGSQIIAAIQTRQEIVVFTDSSIYSLQYVGPPIVWSSQLLGDNISIFSQNAVSIASGRIFWMGIDKFYVYDGRVQTLRCDLRRHVFGNINLNQNQQIFSGTIEAFNEVWWFYCTANSTVIDAYVVYNYVEDIWYYGSLARTAWLDSGLRDYPVAATYVNNLVNHEYGIDDNTSGTPVPIEAYIESAEFDIDDGEHFGFVWRMVPDLTFQGSTAATPQVTMTMYGMNGSGSGFNTEAYKAVARTSTAVIEQFTNIIYTRIRGRQMIIE